MTRAREPGGHLGAALWAEEVSPRAPRIMGLWGICKGDNREAPWAAFCVAQAWLGADLGEPGVPGKWKDGLT